MFLRASIASFLLVATPAWAQVVHQPDAFGDAIFRKTDFGADGLILAGNMLPAPDMTGYTIGRWAPVDAAVDRYVGIWSDAGDFLRFDMTFDGVINPPGPLAINTLYYDPFLYGPNPVFGYIEFDVDADENTGGEVSFPQHRYAGHVARFGGHPAGARFANRVAIAGPQLDNNLLSGPMVERSGEEFHLALFGDHFNAIQPQDDNTDFEFGAGETWLVFGRLLHRAHAFEPFSGSNGNGAYEPNVQLRFSHNVVTNATTITLVYQLNQFGAAQVETNGDPAPVQTSDGSHFNHTSIQEGLENLVSSLAAIPPSDPRRNLPEFALIAGWENRNPTLYLDAHTWKVNAVVGTAYVDEFDSGMLFAPTDVMPSPRFGDFNADHQVDAADFAAFDEFLIEHDGDGVLDAGPGGDGEVLLSGFGPNFCMFDLDYNGAVNDLDRWQIPVLGDLDIDYDVDEIDALLFVNLLVGGGSFNPADANLLLQRADINGDGFLDGADLQGFVDRFLAD